MSFWNLKTNQIWLAFMAIVLVAFSSVSPGLAEDKAKKKAKSNAAWIKICDDVKIKEIKEKEATKKKICMTHHESLNAKTGQPLISAAVRSVAGHKKERLLITVPLGMALPAGVHIKIDKNEPVKFNYSFCHVGGCVGETQMTDAILKQMKAGEKMVVATIAISGKPVGFPVPLSGFGKAYAGKPIDGKKYATARRAMMEDIRKKQIAAAKKAREAQLAKQLKGADKPQKKDKPKK